jgi:hypothetical protein
VFLGRIFLTLTALALFPPAVAGVVGPGAKGYAGSEKCMECHEGIYRQWKLTPHANMLRDAKKNPGAVAARDFSGIPFAKEDIQWAIGSHWFQKYVGFVDNDFYVLPRFWNIVEDRWEPAPIAGWRERPSPIHCDGCHSTGFDPVTKSFHEPSIGCEACHGPGERHVATGAAGWIINPDKLSKERRDMICEACHTEGTDKKAGGMFRFPAFYRPGDDLTLFYSDFFAPKPGSKMWYRGTADYRDRHRMFLFWQSRFYSRSRVCDICGFDSRGAAGKARDMTRDEYCGTCHGKILERAAGHSRHSPGAAECIDCHTPQVAGGGQRYSIHDHKFDFSGPEHPCAECHGTDDVKGKKAGKHDFRFGRVKLRETLTMEQACARCHPDKPVSGMGKKTKGGED